MGHAGTRTDDEPADEIEPDLQPFGDAQGRPFGDAQSTLFGCAQSKPAPLEGGF
jgi:hypothetical protein